MRIDNSLIRYGGLIGAENTKTQTDANTNKTPNAGNVSFENVLRRTIQSDKLVFSKHAEQRLKQRDIELSEDDLKKLGSAVQKAGEKGVQNTLILMDKRAFIVNIKSSTVITAMAEQDIKDNVFTQIDGAVIA
jgi:flagellar operon protein